MRDRRFKNRSFVVGEDGTVCDVKVVKGTGFLTVDAVVVKSVKAWKYKPHPGCMIDMSMAVMIDIR